MLIWHYLMWWGRRGYITHYVLGAAAHSAEFSSSLLCVTQSGGRQMPAAPAPPSALCQFSGEQTSGEELPLNSSDYVIRQWGCKYGLCSGWPVANMITWSSQVKQVPGPVPVISWDHNTRVRGAGGDILSDYHLLSTTAGEGLPGPGIRCDSVATFLLEC